MRLDPLELAAGRGDGGEFLARRLRGLSGGTSKRLRFGNDVAEALETGLLGRFAGGGRTGPRQATDLTALAANCGALGRHRLRPRPLSRTRLAPIALDRPYHRRRSRRRGNWRGR